MHRDIEPVRPRQSNAGRGRSVIAVVGIDNYVAWPRLDNAVSDADAALQLFSSLGFEQITDPLLDRVATGEALRRLVTDDLARLSPDDSLVLFFAGHGHTHTAHFGDVSVKTGCVIPVDAARTDGHVSATWLRLDTWLSDIARLPPRHILVIVDACHSGVALSALHKWRDQGGGLPGPLAALHARRSRRVITSALDDQRAMDGGPYPGHSLFTGCLIEALSGGLATCGRRVTTSREVGQYLQRRVASYPPFTQTPDFGTFELDDRGDIVIPILRDVSAPAPTESQSRHDATGLLETGGADIASGTPRASDPRRWIALGLAVVALSAIAGDGSAPGNLVSSDPHRAAPRAPTASTERPTSSPSGAENRPVQGVAAPRVVEPSGSPPAPPIPSRPPERSRQSSSPPPIAPVAAQAPLPVRDVPSVANNACSEASFAAIYQAASPGADAIDAALHRLNACRDAGAITGDDYARYQVALVARL